MDQVIRKNTLEFNFAKVPDPTVPNGGRPSALEIYKWLALEIGLTSDQVDTIQLDHVRNSVFVKCVSDLLVDKILLKHGEQKMMTTEANFTIVVTIKKCETNRKIVRVQNLLPEVENVHVQKSLSSYGTIESIKDETIKAGSVYFAGIKTGVRLVTMIIKQHIPSCVTIQGFRALITYQGQVRTCVMCHSPDHFRNACPQLRKAETRFQAFRDACLEKNLEANISHANDLDGSTTMVKLPDPDNVLHSINTATIAESNNSGDINSTNQQGTQMVIKETPDPDNTESVPQSLPEHGLNDSLEQSQVYIFSPDLFPPLPEPGVNDTDIGMEEHNPPDEERKGRRKRGTVLPSDRSRSRSRSTSRSSKYTKQ